jgi:hypothetical protein
VASSQGLRTHICPGGVWSPGFWSGLCPCHQSWKKEVRRFRGVGSTDSHTVRLIMAEAGVGVCQQEIDMQETE